MKKGATVEDLSREAVGLHTAGRFREALSKHNAALALAQRTNDEQTIASLTLNVISCYGDLLEVWLGASFSAYHSVHLPPSL